MCTHALCVCADAAGVSAQGKACNVAKSADVRALADYAQQQLGTIDLWWVRLGCYVFGFGFKFE